MAFTVRDYHDLVRLLAEHPEWRPELRRLVLSDELLSLPEIVRELAEAQRRSEARLTGVEERLTWLEVVVTDLAEAQRRTEARLERLEEAVHSLAQAQERTEETVRLLADRQNKMRGDILQDKYARRAYAYFGRQLRRAQTILPGPALDAAVEDAWETRLTPDELMEVFETDVIVAGRLRRPPTPEAAELWLAVEVSAVNRPRRRGTRRTAGGAAAQGRLPGHPGCRRGRSDVGRHGIAAGGAGRHGAGWAQSRVGRSTGGDRRARGKLKPVGGMLSSGTGA